MKTQILRETKNNSNNNNNYKYTCGHNENMTTIKTIYYKK